MKLKSLIEYLQGKLDEHKAKSVKPNAYSETQRETYLINLEADYTFRMFQAATDQFKNEPADKDITSDHIKTLTDSLKNRWSRIKSTDASYCIEVTGSANIFCRQLASYLVTQHQSLIGHASANKLLMPTVTRWRNAGNDSTDLSNALPHRFVLDDANESVFELGHLIEDICQDKILLGSRTVMGTKEIVWLSDDELNRVTKHSQHVINYFEEVKLLLPNKEKNVQKINKLKFALRDELLDNGYVKNSNTITDDAKYGSNGQTLLKTNMLADVDNLFADREQLLDYMSGKLMHTEWEEFLSRFSKEGLRKVFCQGATVSETVKSDAMNNGKFLHDIAADYCKITVYWNKRSAEPDYTTVKGRLFGGDSKDDIELAVQAFKVGLTVTRGALSNWAGYVEGLDPKVAELMKRRKRGYIYRSIEATIERQLQLNDHKKLNTQTL